MAEGNKSETAAAAAGMSPRSAHNWKTGALPSQSKRERHWRSRLDAFKKSDSVAAEKMIMPFPKGLVAC
jgi:hypothetical protein